MPVRRGGLVVKLRGGRHRHPEIPSVNRRKPESCNGRALDRVTKQKHRPNRQTLSKKCPKIVVSAPPDNFWTFFGHFFDIFRTFCRHSLFLGCPMVCPLQPERDGRKGRAKNCHDNLRQCVCVTFYDNHGLPKGGFL